MSLHKCKLGELITQRREKNNDDSLPISGVSKDGLIPPKQQEADTSLYNMFYRGDFIFNPARMELNSIAYNDKYDKAICSSLYEVFYVHRTDLILPEFLALIVKQDWFTRYCEFLGQGSAREYCRFANISEIEIEFPDLDVQERTVHCYNVIKRRIELKQRINDNLAEQLKALYVKLFGVYTDDYESIIERNQTPKTLSDLCSFISKGITPSYSENSAEMIINQKCINNNRINYTFVKYHIPKNKNEKWLRNGDVLINSTGAGTLGRSAQYWGKSDIVTVDSHITIVRADKELYKYYIGVLCQMLQPVFENMQTGSTAQTDLPRERLKAMSIGLPSEERLLMFNKMAEKTIIMINDNEKELIKLEELKEILVSQIVS